ncbi:hypothetical protein SAMN05216319_1425 [Duganella sp. CF402]|uniref:hypothetical protein n=1 Tax=unclassified Duganella TaxID=2636909 RepID=UPI0008ADFE91|nr:MULTISPECIES: hypothetical protein [unclassified Duganella]SEL27379.1 hypothetical protein SAMN05216319_1425 [Duganella sp. CF402]
MSRTHIAIQWLLALIALFPFIAHAQTSLIAGTWELTYVAPQDVMNTMPNGVSNQKLHFTEAGKLYVLSPMAQGQKTPAMIARTTLDFPRKKE